MSGKTAVLLLAHGTPESAQDVPAYMRNITSGRPIPDAVMQEVQHRYSVIGRSPLTDITLQQASLLAESLELPVYVGMRNWHPFIADTVNVMMADKVKRAIVICLAPQNSRTSVGMYKNAVVTAAGDKMELDFVESWHDHPLLIRAFAEKLAPAWEQACKECGAKVPVVFTAHSVPCRTIANTSRTAQGDPYSVQAKQTAALVAGMVPGMTERDWHFAFQSQGMSGGTWIGPTVESTIDALREEGHRGVLIHPVGFVCDHVEVLYDIDILFKHYAGDRGMKLWRPESLNTSPHFISGLADLARSRLQFESTVALPSAAQAR